MEQPTLIDQYYIVREANVELRLRAKTRTETTYELGVKRGSGQRREEPDPIFLDEEQAAGMANAAVASLRKVRHLCPNSIMVENVGFGIELDIYRGDLEGLAVAEVELTDFADGKELDVPDWFGKEVTTDPRFKNKNLASAGLKGISRWAKC